MDSSPQDRLLAFKRQHSYFVGIDSDGCVFDTMEIKHKECFIPNIIKHWGLQAVSKYAREVAEFVNLYSKWRGINRFPALLMTFDLLAERPEVQKRGVKMPEVPSLREWASKETKLGNPALQEAVNRTNDPVLAQALAWSKSVNASIEDIVHGVPPYPYVRESLGKLAKFADIVIVSATPYAALKREWEEHDLAKLVSVIAGQEMGTKKQHIQLSNQGRYRNDHILMIGDAPGDMKAARGNNALFFPVNPGAEDKSWEMFYNEAFDRFLSGTYKGDYEAELIAEFETFLPEIPPWKRQTK
jgi:phosphoglycolate phosphatase-like HAD superfamily hydrolase